MLPTTTDVLVVGAGPTGLTVAVSLVARGREVTVIDNQEQGQNTSRASVVYSRTLEVLEPYGVAQRLAAQGIHARRFTIRDRDRVLMNVAFDWLPTAYPYTLLVSQAITESILLRRLEQLGGRVLRPYTLTGLDQDSSGVTGTFAGGERIRARYVVGADGTHSTVREQAGIGLDASAAGASYSLADVHLWGGMPAEELHQAPDLGAIRANVVERCGLSTSFHAYFEACFFLFDGLTGALGLAPTDRSTRVLGIDGPCWLSLTCHRPARPSRQQAPVDIERTATVASRRPLCWPPGVDLRWRSGANLHSMQAVTPAA